MGAGDKHRNGGAEVARANRGRRRGDDQGVGPGFVLLGLLAWARSYCISAQESPIKIELKRSIHPLHSVGNRYLSNISGDAMRKFHSKYSDGNSKNNEAC